MGRIIHSLIAGLLMAVCTTRPEELILQADLSTEHDEWFTSEAYDQQRVARFMISEGWSRDSAKVNLNKGDLLQIRLSYTEKEFVSDPLVKTREGIL